MNDILKKPVHPVVYNYTELEKLSHSKELLKTSVSLEQYRRADMPVEIKQPRSLIKHKDVKLSTLQKTRARVKLKVIYDSPKLKLPKEAIPDCKNCKTQACCVAFIVQLTPLEYDSGIFGDKAIKITREAAEQLKNSNVLYYSMMQLGGVLDKDRNEFYFLEGSVGRACPYLGDNGCTIYNDRPLTCRGYTCTYDERITQEIKDGTKPMLGEQLHVS